MRLEGTLDAFSLPDIFQLLSYTKKTGTLHLRRSGAVGEAHGVVHLRDGAVTGARSDVRRQALGRRLVGAGLVDDDVLADAVARVRSDPSCGLARALGDSGALAEEDARGFAAEQATDAVFDLLRWPDGEFAFVVDEPDPDDLGAAIPVDDIVAEGRRRIESWDAAAMPDMAAVVSLVPSPAQDPTPSRDDWSLLSLVDGRRTVGDLVALSGRGEYVVVSLLAGLVDRGLLAVGAPVDELVRRQELLGALEGTAAPTAPTAPASGTRRGYAPVVPPRTPVTPERPEPFSAPRQPEHAEPGPSYVRASVGEVHGAVAMQPAPEGEPAVAPYIERDPSVNKSLLLRLIAGVRGL